MKAVFVAFAMVMTPIASTFALQATVKTMTADQDCKPPLKACKEPVKWLADKNNCSCFACEYGKPSQHVGCTEDKEVKAALLTLQSGPDRDKRLASAPLQKFVGTVISVGNAIRFRFDTNGEDYDVANPEALKGHEGRRLHLKARVDTTDEVIKVVSIEKANGDKEPIDEPDSVKEKNKRLINGVTNKAPKKD